MSNRLLDRTYRINADDCRLPGQFARKVQEPIIAGGQDRDSGNISQNNESCTFLTIAFVLFLCCLAVAFACGFASGFGIGRVQ